MNVAVRAAPAFASYAYDTVALPLPLVAVVIRAHDAEDAAVHAHVERDAVNVTEPVPDVLPTLADAGAMLNEQPPDCCTDSVELPTLMVAFRTGPSLALTVYVTVPFPVPDAALNEIQPSEFDVAFHEHAGEDAVTVAEACPPFVAKLALVGAIANVQPFAW